MLGLLAHIYDLHGNSIINFYFHFQNASLKDISNSPHLPSDMTLPINLENYKTKYKSLLFHEEEEHKNIIDEV